jgi:hypothetical protein
LRYFLPRAGESQERRMAEKRKAPADASQRRRAPTIDLTATEVPNEQANEQAAAAPAPPEPNPEATSAPPPAGAPSAEPVQGPAEASAPPSEPFPEETPPAAEDAPSTPPPPRSRSGGLLSGSALALVVVLWVLAGLWYAGVLPGPGAQQADQLTRLETQVTGLQKETADLKSRLDAVANAPAPANAVGQKTIDALTQRVAKLERDASKPASGPNDAATADLTKRLTAAEAALKANDETFAALKNQIATTQAVPSQQTTQQFDQLGRSVADLQARVQQLAQQSAAVSAEQFKALRDRVAAIGQSMQAAQKQLAQNAAAASAVRLALSATTLREAVFSHAPYVRELSEVKALGGDAKALAPLQRFAASGVPSDAQLAAELRTIVASLAPPANSSTASGSFLDRLRANAEQLVRVTPANAPSGDAPSDVLARLSLDAEHANVDAAVKDIEKLPPATQAKLADWAAKARARGQAVSAARAFAAQAVHALGGE